jgi:hypothetical protein
VPVRSKIPSEPLSAQSGLDRRAIDVARHLLTTGIWLEHQPRSIPTPRTGFVGRSRVRSPLRRVGSVDVESSQSARRQVSPPAVLALTSR